MSFRGQEADKSVSVGTQDERAKLEYEWEKERYTSCERIGINPKIE